MRIMISPILYTYHTTAVVLVENLELYQVQGTVLVILHHCDTVRHKLRYEGKGSKKRGDNTVRCHKPKEELSTVKLLHNI